MSLREQQAVVVRLVTNGPFRDLFFDAPPDAHAKFNLTPEEFAALRQLDRHLVSLAGHGNVYKRFDTIHPGFPVAVRYLETRVPDFRERYAAQFLMALDKRRELDQFRDWAAALPLPEAERPFLRALLAFERQARELPVLGLADWRLRDEIRPRRREGVLRWESDVDLVPALEAAAENRPVEAQPPGETARLLAWNEQNRLRWERLRAHEIPWLDAAEGARTLAELREAFGEEADTSLVRWLRLGVLVPA